MDGGSVGAAIPGAHNPVTYIEPQRRDSVISEDSAIELKVDDLPLHARNQNTSVLHPPLSEVPEVENTPGRSLQIIEDSEAHLADTTKPLSDQYEQIHIALLRSIKVIEGYTEKLCRFFNADKISNAFKEEDICEEANTDFCLARELSTFKALFSDVKEAIYGLKTDSYSSGALQNLKEVSKRLGDRHAMLKSNLPPPQSKKFKPFNHLLEGLSTLIVIVAAALAGLGIAVSTTAPCAAAGAIYCFVRAWSEKITLPEDNKNKYLIKLEKMYADTFSALRLMEDDMLVIEQREQHAQVLEEQRKQTQKILDAMTQPALSNASDTAVLAEFEKRIDSLLLTLSPKQREALAQKLSPERTPSPEGFSISSREHATPAALTGQA